MGTCESPSRSTDFARAHSETPVPMLPLVLDRERIVHSSAFRRLQQKTQVFVTFREDHFRTRLTHTLEVAHLARRLAASLAADVDLAEVAALAHDLGHPPFGHAGEAALNECLAGHGGFEHNVQALRVVEYLEHPYPEFRGLNLTRIVRECLAKHATKYDKPGKHPLQDGQPPPIEGRIAALADRIAYALHDIHDGLYAGLIDIATLGVVPLWQRFAETVSLRTPQADTWRSTLRPTTDRLQEHLLQAAAAATRGRMGKDSHDCRHRRSGIVGLPDEVDRELSVLEGLLFERLYRHARIQRSDGKAGRIIQDVFDAYIASPILLPERFQLRIESQGIHRVAADYIAGMTDRFILREWRRVHV